jgi:ribosome-associated translation inhibitor RaiA
MNTLFELRQKDVVLTPAAAEAIEARSEKFARHSDRIQRCTVTVEGPSKHHRQGNYGVQIDLLVPGTELVVRKHSEANLEAALKSAFEAIDRRLEEQVRKSRGYVKAHPAR